MIFPRNHAVLNRLGPGAAFFVVGLVAVVVLMGLERLRLDASREVCGPDFA